MGHEMKGKNIYDVFKSSLDFAPATALHRNHLSTLEGAIKGFRVFKATLFVLRRGGLKMYPRTDRRCASLCTATNKKLVTFLF